MDDSLRRVGSRDFLRELNAQLIGRSICSGQVKYNSCGQLFGKPLSRQRGVSKGVIFLSQRIILLSIAIFCVSLPCVEAANHEFYGRSGNGIEVDFGELPGVPGDATFSNLLLSGFNGHTVLTSSDLQQGNFSTDGRLWVFPNPARNTEVLGDIDAATRGFQGRLEGSISVDGQQKSFAVNVRPGYTGSGPGSVGQSLERINRAANNRLFVAQQQHRLNYLGFVAQGGGQLAVDGDFGPNTDSALSTFQGAFVAGVNTTQASVDGIVGPNTAGWLNAANAPTWEELVDPDPQVPGNFSVANMIGDFDILPSRDPGTNIRSGLTPQIERFGTNWALSLWRSGSAAAKDATSITQLMNGMSTDDGYGSAFAHSTHRVGMDIDMHVASSTHNFGNGFTSQDEQGVIDAAIAYIDAGAVGGSESGHVLRIITSNSDIRNGIRAARPAVATYLDSSTVHQNHLHIDVGAPSRVAGVAATPGDYDFDNEVNAFDFLVWQRGASPNPLSGADLSQWQTNYGSSPSLAATSIAVPEPSTSSIFLLGMLILGTSRSRSCLR